MRPTILLLLAAPACVAPVSGSATDPDSSSTALTASPSTAATTTLVDAGSHLCVDVQGASMAQGGLLQQWGCWGGANQAFRLVAQSGGTYEVVGSQSGLCLGAGASTTAGARIAQSTCTGAPGQLFAVRQSSAGQYTLAGSQSGLCLAVDGGSLTNGASLLQWSCDGTPSQAFALRLPAGAQPTGQNYYVSPSGKDANDGRTPATAWQSMAKVSAAAFLPGDAVSFARGATFQGTLDVSSSGTTGRPITYGAYGQGARPVFTGGTYGVSATARSWIVLRDVQIHGTTDQGVYLVAPSSDEANGCTHWVIDDLDLQGTAGGVFAAFDSDILVENSVMHDGTAEFLYAWKGDGIQAIGNTILTLYGQYTDNIQFEWTTNFEVRCNYATMAGSNSGKGNLIATDGSGGTVVDNTFVAGNYGFASGDGSIYVANNQFVDNASADTWSSGIKIAGPLADGAANNDVNDVTIAHNLFVSPNKGIYIYDGNTADPSGPGSRKDFQITGNVFEGAADAIEIESTLTGSSVANNTVWTASSDKPAPASPIVLPTSCADGLSPHL
ncbi:MAG TPA: RICIN domain-containing protein [Polyangiaceae bacterium]